VGTEVILAPELGPTVIVGSSVIQMTPYAEEVFLSHEMLVVDGIPWGADLEVIRGGLVKKRRAFKAPYLERVPTITIAREVEKLLDDAKRVFPMLYPNFKSIEERTSFRPMITGPEPLHFDSYGGLNPMVTAYINVSRVPRVYAIGANLPMLVREMPNVMRAWVKAAKKLDVSYVLRKATEAGEGPLGPKAPRHKVELAPGAIWFFNAKTVSHEVVYGEGAVGISWEVPDCGAQMPADILKGLL
jgi:hypothetical protein